MNLITDVLNKAFADVDGLNFHRNTKGYMQLVQWCDRYVNFSYTSQCWNDLLSIFHNFMLSLYLLKCSIFKLRPCLLWIAINWDVWALWYRLTTRNIWRWELLEINTSNNTEWICSTTNYYTTTRILPNHGNGVVVHWSFWWRSLWPFPCICHFIYSLLRNKNDVIQQFKIIVNSLQIR